MATSDRSNQLPAIRNGDRLSLDEFERRYYARPHLSWFPSETFPGLWLDPAALIRGDLAAVHQAMQPGLATPEHAAFIDRLRAIEPH